jgi:hypothetical protein
VTPLEEAEMKTFTYERAADVRDAVVELRRR